MKKAFLITCLLLVLMFLLSLMTSADVYMWKDEEGNIHMTKHKPPEGAEIIKAIVHPTPTGTPNYHPYATPLKKKSDQKKRDDQMDDSSKPLPTSTPHLDDMGHGETWWRNHKSNLQKSLANKKNRIEEINDRLYYINEVAEYDNPKERNKLITEKEDLKKGLKEIEAELDDLEYSVQQAGGYPGWVRD